ncbi:carbohydrate ABC transporter permease [Paenibacillus thalictri]|uniref:Sugar ABC transporter permease n=1 Tax=Paenibacillus thalictri TaxID=2527873 RepID=A0A4Q9DP67_9BACL|nr:sugar ABC transporter permease [Paenibacillus thalictri]TBL76383.1 sugar ABC transporter permease [Paenibacillus thalictri]
MEVVRTVWTRFFDRTATQSYARSSSRIFLILTLPALLLHTAFFAYPVVMGFFFSLTDWDGISKKYNIIGFANYLEILKDKRFLDSLLFSFKYTLLAVVLKMAIALALALLLSGNVKFRNFMRSVFFFPAVLSLITIGLIFNQIYYEILPKAGEALGIEWLSVNILGSAKTAIYGLIITNVWHGVAVPMIIFLAGLTSVPKDLHEAARIDGATGLQRFFSITLPFLIPMLNVNLVVTIKGGLTVFESIVALTDGGPGTSTESIAFLIYRHGLNEFKFGYATAESIYIFLLIAFISFIQLKWLNKKEVGQL